MSVALYYDEELCGLWYDLGGDPDLRQHLAVLAAANRAAYTLTYGEIEAEWVTLPEPRERTSGWRPSVGNWVDNLAYNCVSNGGTDFAPADSVAALKAAVDAQLRKQRQELGFP